MRPLVAVALSGGVDSLVAAYLLKNEGYELLGIHFLTGYEAGGPPSPTAAACPAALRKTRQTARRRFSQFARQLEMPIEVLDCSPDFQRLVVSYFQRTYRYGRTPNPCLVCNAAVKFGTVLRFAESLGAAALATGHYSRVESGPDGRVRLFKGADPRKDQSYFLSRLTQDQLRQARFPLGAMQKRDVAALAAEKGLEPLAAAESQDVCFIRQGSYREFLDRDAAFTAVPGPIVDTQGRALGTHRGLHRYTIGQRRGIGCPAADPYYVVGIDSRRNRLIVGSREDLLARCCRVARINWIAAPPRAPVAVEARLRYRHRAARALLRPDGDGEALLVFETRQAAIAPGQGAVFYRGDEVLGGGWIVAAQRECGPCAEVVAATVAADSR
jgi:tRNA-specific 2-thiouridylase